MTHYPPPGEYVWYIEYGGGAKNPTQWLRTAHPPFYDYHEAADYVAQLRIKKFVDNQSKPSSQTDDWKYRVVRVTTEVEEAL